MDLSTSNTTDIIDIIKIQDPKKFFSKNLNSIYLFNTYGIRDFQEDDEIGRQIINLKKIKYIFNVNEIFIFRTFNYNQICVYEILENRLHIIQTKYKILNVYLTIENYILLKYETLEDLELINYKDFKSIKIQNVDKNKILLHENIFDLVIQIVTEYHELFKTTIRKKNYEYIILPISTVPENTNKIFSDFIEEENNKIMCERIWGVFVLQKEICYTFSIIENEKRIFKYYVDINNKKKFFNNILDMISFMQTNFYTILAECTFLIQ